MKREDSIAGGGPERDWEQTYRETPLEELPWEEGKPAAELVALVESGTVDRGPVLDVCSGSGNNAIYLAGQGYDCHGIDISETAVGHARRKAALQGVSCELSIGDVVRLPYPDDIFTLVFDRGCFHSMSPGDREPFIKGVHRVLRPAGKYLMLCFSSRDHAAAGAPYSFSPADIHRYFSPCFRIRFIREFSSGGRGLKHYFLSCLMEKLQRDLLPRVTTASRANSP